MDEETCCPHCRQNDDVATYAALTISLEDWYWLCPLMFLVAVLAGSQGFAPSESAFFAILSIIPFCVSVRIKRCCERCKIQFWGKPERP